MNETPLVLTRAVACAATVALFAVALPAAHGQARTSPVASTPSRAAAPEPKTGDYIVAIVNQELVTNGELQARLERVRQDAQRSRQSLPPPEQLRKEVLDQLIDERVQVTYARENGVRIDESEIDRAVTNVAIQNQITLPQLREQLRREGIDYGRFRSNVRDQLMTERAREREVAARVRITDAEVDAFLEKRAAAGGAAAEFNLAQILITVPENASPAEVQERRARAEAALARVRSVAPFDVVAREVSDDANKAKGGEIGMRSIDRLPDVFVDAVRTLKPGEISPVLLRTGAGFHILKVLDRRDGGAFSVPQTHVRHILLRTSPQLSQEAAQRRLLEFKRQIESGQKSFEAVARENSEDGSAPQGGDLGWAAPGTFVPEFEAAMAALAPGGISDPVVSRFGVHLIQVVDRRQVTLEPKQQREQARNVLREQKFEPAFNEWIRELRGRAYIEMREPPQ